MKETKTLQTIQKLMTIGHVLAKIVRGACLPGTILFALGLIFGVFGTGGFFKSETQPYTDRTGF